MVPGRNDPCPCGSGKKYKRCHGLGRRPGCVADAIGLRAGEATARARPPKPPRRCAKSPRKWRRRRAESLYRELLEQQPDHVEASTALGALLDDLGRLDEAEAVFRRLVEGDAPTGFGTLQSRRHAVQARSRRRGVGGLAARRVDAARLRDRARQPRCDAGDARALRRGGAVDSRGAGDRRAHAFRTQQPRHAAGAPARRRGACLLRPRARDRSHLLRCARPACDAIARAGPHCGRGDGAGGER